MNIREENVPVDGKWHKYALGVIVHVVFQKKGYVTFYWDTRIASDALQTRYLRAYRTGQHLPAEAIYIGSCQDPNHEMQHLFWTDEFGSIRDEPLKEEDNVPSGERPH